MINFSVGIILYFIIAIALLISSLLDDIPLNEIFIRLQIHFLGFLLFLVIRK